MPRAPLRGAVESLHGLDPVLDRNVRTLVLGSFTSAASLAAGEYYAHPRNQFWPIVGAVLDEPFAELPYAARLRRLLAHAIGLWDVIGACERRGSLDSAIRHERENEIAQVVRAAPRLRRVIFNGKMAGRAAARFEAAGFATVVVPSSSPALASVPLIAKVAAWRRALHGDAPSGGAREPGRSSG